MGGSSWSWARPPCSCCFFRIQPSISIKILQIIIGTFFMDKWQYFAHRYMLQNKFLHRYVHSQHHRLVVPDAIGALYNHPLEGLLLDTLGGAIRSSSQVDVADDL
ncbi:hypothetical protein NC653_014460 [Populus alba x Populus x berolinensis]|uniref:Fatty acid hydroxylase domain-containing protein n=1 Tax=Populus alba x Populus x berolinensis TaxID=444605 RepID=A0AAD6QX55_9ROSI|nr:hypothetical protein NC653_014460 [Populus alba x Populus x berolinensis]